MKHIKLLMFSLAFFLFLIVTVGCQSNNDNEGMNDRNNRNDNIENTRYDRNLNNDNRDGLINNDRTTRNNRNNTLDNNRIENRTDKMTNRNENRYDVSEEAAEKITNEIDEIDYAYVLTTNNNAYVAAVLDTDNNDRMNNNRSIMNDKNNNNNRSRANDDGMTRNINNEDAHELTDDVKTRISDIVKSVDGDINNVYVTTNPDFANLTNDYINDTNEGRPIRGFFDQIGNMIERIFPQNNR